VVYVRFGQDGYKVYDQLKQVIFSGDSNHESLFDYVAKDVSELTQLLEDYVARRMDISTFELKEYNEDYSEAIRIKNVLKNLHPYYNCSFNVRDTIINALGDYINLLLIQAQYERGTSTISFPIEYEWYKERFVELGIPFSTEEDITHFPDTPFLTPQAFEYFSRFNEAIGIAPTRRKESGYFEIKELDAYDNHEAFESVIETHNEIHRLLFWLLDQSNSLIGSLSIPQRLWIYQNVFKKNFVKKVTQRLALATPTLYEDKIKDDEIKKENAKEKLFSSLETLRWLHLEEQEILPEEGEAFEKVLELSSQYSSGGIYDEYEITDISQLLFLEILQIAKNKQQLGNKLTIKKCQYCNMYFIAPRSNALYCNRIVSGEDKPCSKIGAKRLHDTRINSSEAEKLYRTAYNRHYAYIRNAVSAEAMDRNERKFKDWQVEAKENIQEYDNGTIDFELLSNWMQNSSI